MKNIENISFIGLGVMGYPMAGHLSKLPDRHISVYNRHSDKVGRWVSEYNGEAYKTPAEAAESADLICICVGRDADLREVITGEEGILKTVKAGTIIVDHTTVSAKVSREMSELCALQDVEFMDAPVSGGQAGAENGMLTVMCGGDVKVFDHVAPLLRQAYAKEIRYMGECGAGQLTKMVNQICIAGTLQGLSEGLNFGLTAGLDMDEVLAVIGQGAAQSWQMDNRGGTMVRNEFDFGFALDWMIKDLGIAIAESESNGANLTNTKILLDYYKELSSEGAGRCDTSALIKRLR